MSAFCPVVVSFVETSRRLVHATTDTTRAAKSVRALSQPRAGRRHRPDLTWSSSLHIRIFVPHEGYKTKPAGPLRRRRYGRLANDSGPVRAIAASALRPGRSADGRRRTPSSRRIRSYPRAADAVVQRRSLLGGAG